MEHEAPIRLAVSEPIQTARLVLRPFVTNDLGDLVAIASDPEIARYLYRDVRTEAQTAEALAGKVRESLVRTEGDVLSLAATLGAGGPVVADLMLRYRSHSHKQAEIGYVPHPAHHGQGLATEAGRVLLELAFEQLGAHRTYGALDARNTASARVLEKLGMRREAHLVENEWVKGEWSDEVIYGILDREWAAQRASGG